VRGRACPLCALAFRAAAPQQQVPDDPGIDDLLFTRWEMCCLPPLDATACCRRHPSAPPTHCRCPPHRRAGLEEVGCDDRRRFELELEFLHCLANPGYLNCEPPRQGPAAVLENQQRCARAPCLPALRLLCPPPTWLKAAGLPVACRAGPEPVSGGPRFPKLPAVPAVLAAAAVRPIHCVSRAQVAECSLGSPAG